MIEPQQYVTLALLLQIAVLSVLLPGTVVVQLRRILIERPADQFPLLYPAPPEVVQRGLLLLSFASGLVLLIGLGLLAQFALNAETGLLGKDPFVVVILYAGLQFLAWTPVLFHPGFSIYTRFRQSESGPRRAEMRPRRLRDFARPVEIALPVLCWAAFCIAVVAQPERFGGGLWNLVWITLMQGAFAFGISVAIHGKPRNPLQQSSERHAQIRTAVRANLWGSVGGSIFLFSNAALQIADSPFQPVVLCVYFASVGLGQMAVMRLGHVDFDVYRGHQTP